VGVKGVRYPLRIMVGGVEQSTVALWVAGRGAAGRQEGHPHVPLRGLAGLALDAPLDAGRTAQRHGAMLHKLGAQEGRIEAAFSFFLRKRAPVSGVAEPDGLPGPLDRRNA
jgi:GTP cyclohydrolase I